MPRPTVTFTTGTPGAGKTFVRCACFLAQEFLPECSGRIWTNYPVYPEVMAEYVAERSGLPYAELVDRIRIIPKEVLARWKRGESGPWEFFANTPIQGDHIAIDEIHNFCATEGMPGACIQRWKEWLGELRHTGASAEFISQAPEKVHKVIEMHAERWYELVKAESRRDPFTRILLGDWYELRAKFLTGRYTSAVWQFEKRKVSKRFVTEDVKVFWFKDELFKLYDSHAAPEKGGVKGREELKEFEKRSTWGLLRWFLWRNGFRLAPWVLGFPLFIWFCFMGGGGAAMTFLVQDVMGEMTKTVHDNDPIRVTSAAVGGSAQGRVLPGGGGDITSAQGPVLPRGAASQPTTQAVDPEILHLREVVANLQGERVKLVEEVRQRDADLAALSAVSLLTAERVTLRNGLSYGIGDEIDFGRYKGLRVEGIDFSKRLARLSDGTILRMGSGAAGSSWLQRFDAVAESSGLSGGVPATQRSATSQPTGGGGGSHHHAVSGRNAASDVPAVRQ